MNLRTLQIEQQAHDLANHFDIASLHRGDRLKHYGLHFSKYVGRLARGHREFKTAQQTIVDAMLVALSAANALNQKLESSLFAIDESPIADLFYFADACGRFADACEKLDHLEEFRGIALDSNKDIITWILKKALELNLDLNVLISDRRAELAKRQSYNP
jgi:hypothetical protein